MYPIPFLTQRSPKRIDVPFKNGNIINADATVCLNYWLGDNTVTFTIFGHPLTLVLTPVVLLGRTEGIPTQHSPAIHLNKYIAHRPRRILPPHRRRNPSIRTGRWGIRHVARR
jgi:hypothetical protein